MLSYLKSLNLNQKSFLVAILLHGSLLFLIFFDFRKDQQVPILSFSVTVSDEISISQNNISATTIAKSSESKQKEKIEKSENKNQDKLVKEQEEQSSKDKSKGDNLTNSKQQNAVVSKDSPAIFNAAYLNNPSPNYPSASKKSGEQGKVLLDVYVNEEGMVEQIKIAKSSGFQRLDNTALNTVIKWQFVPAKKGGKLEKSWVQVPINFVLE